MRTVLSVVSILGLCVSPISADCRRVRVNAAVVVEQVISPVFISTFAVPAYTVGYAPQAAYAQPTAQSDTDALLRQILARLDNLEKGGGAPQQAALHPGVTFLEQTCAKCHNVDVAQAKGGNKVLFNFGKLVKLTGDEWGVVLAEIDSGRMPKGGPKVTDEQYSNVVAAFVAQAKAPRVKAEEIRPPQK